MENRESRSIVVGLDYRVDAAANAAQIADAIEAIWKELDTTLFAVIGQRGVSALYQRTLFVVARTHPWLMRAYEGLQSNMNLPLLRIVLLQQTNANAAAGANALLQTFYEILNGLVGPSLTESLLLSVWTNSSSGPAAQDNSL